MGAAGSEYGVRGYVMAYNTDLKPAWPNPFWTIPPEQQQWRRLRGSSAAASSGRRSRSTSRTNTVYFGTGSGTPNYFPDLHLARTRARTRSSRSTFRPGSSKLVAAARSRNDQWDTTSPSRRWSTTPRSAARRGASSPWRRRRASGSRSTPHRRGVPRAREGDRPRRASAAAAGPAGRRSSRPRSAALNYSPAAYDPKTNYVFNAAAETAAVLIQEKLTPTQKKRKFILGDVFLGLENGNFGETCAGWHDHGSISAIDVSTGRRVWKFDTPEPERGGVTTTASGLGFAGGGDGVLRAFDLQDRQGPLDVPDGRARSRRAPTIFSAGGKEYVAITVGGTPTSSNGGACARSCRSSRSAAAKTESPTPLRADARGVRAPTTRRARARRRAAAAARRERVLPAAAARRRAARRPAARSRCAPGLPSGNNTQSVPRPPALGGKPVVRRPDLGRPVRAPAGDGRRRALHGRDRRHARAPPPRQGRPTSRAPASAVGALTASERAAVRARDRRLHRRLPDRRA